MNPKIMRFCHACGTVTEHYDTGHCCACKKKARPPRLVAPMKPKPAPDANPMLDTLIEQLKEEAIATAQATIIHCPECKEAAGTNDEGYVNAAGKTVPCETCRQTRIDNAQPDRHLQQIQTRTAINTEL
jgi:hypothetical protein